MSTPSRPRQANPYELLPAPATFTLSSNDLTDGERMPNAQVDISAGGEAISPHLAWEGAPEGTKSFVVTCYDPDAPTVSGFWHWNLLGLPADTSELPTGESADAPGIQLRNDGGETGYMGAAPPPGDHEHRYFFTVHALDCEPDDLGLDETASNATGSFATIAHEIGRAQLMVTWDC